LIRLRAKGEFKLGKRKRNGKVKNERTKRPAISACLIVKDEEGMLPRCLESIKDAVDEIVVVDTGSSDRTVEIAQSFGARVYQHPWENDFSKHRNQSISYALGEWIFIIDADEELVGKDVSLLRSAIHGRNSDAIMVEVVSKLGNGRSQAVHCVERLFRNNGLVHYEGRIHNRLVGVREAKILPIRLFHYGYDLGPEAAKEKFERTVSLLKRDLEEDPHNPLTYHYLGCSYLTQGMLHESLQASAKAIKLASATNDTKLIYLWSHFNAAMCCYKLQDLEQAEKLCRAALEKYPNHVDSHFVLSLVAFDQGRWKDVILHGHEYMKLAELQERSPETFDNLVICSLKERWNISAISGMAYAELGESEKAEESFRKAMDWALEPFVVSRAAGIFFYNKGLLHKARSYLAEADKMSESDETVRRLLEEINVKLGEAEKASTISCCMIVKNEEAFLDQCLKSVKDYVDEMIIVDTGSSDKTVYIARRYTDKVYFHPWEGSFSKARNQASVYASGDWIFIIDGDEELVKGSGERLRETVRCAGDADAILVNTISTYSKGTKKARHNSERLFRNNGMIHYEGIVHNRVVGFRSLKASRIEVMHYGYDLDEKKANEKFLRTTGLLKKQVTENPNDPMPHHYLGVSYLSRGMNEDAVRESVMAIELAERNNDPHPLYIWAHHNAAMAYFRMADLDKAKGYSLDALKKYSDHLDSYYMLAMVAAERAEWQEVLVYGEKYLQLRDLFEKEPERAGVVINGSMNEGPAVHLLIGHTRHALGETSEMEKEYELAATLSENPWQAWWNAGCFHLDRTGDLDLAQRYLAAALAAAPEQQEVWYMLAKLHNKKGALQEERRCLEALWKLGSEDPVVLKRLASLCLEAGECSFARKVYEKMIELDPTNDNALCSLGRTYQQNGETGKAITFFQRALEVDQEHPDPWLHLGEISLAMGRLSEARDFFERLFSLRAHELQALLYLCEIEMKEDRIIEFVNTCDRILERLQLNRKRVINNLPDMMVVLGEVREALKDRSHLASQADKLLALLAHRIKEFVERTQQGESRTASEIRAPA
jgi:glycosyltransferase involved in cell wall biosynthesis